MLNHPRLQEVSVAQLKETSSASPAKTIPRIYEIDGLRGLAAVWVMMFHYFGDNDFPSLVKTIIRWGACGVDLFYVLSGFLVGSILLNHRHSLNFLPTFYARRASRILPLLYLYLGVSYFIYEIVPKTPTLSLMPYWAYALLINDFWSCRYLTLGKISVLWSLAIEEKFYLVTPLLIRFVEKKGQFAVVILALMASVGRQMSLQDQFQFAPPIELSVFRWEGLCLGLLIAMYFFYEGKTLLNQRIAKIAFPVGFFVATALCLVDFPSVIWKGTYFLRFSIGFSFLLLTVLSYQGFKFTAVLRNRMMIWLGTISYGVYLFHPLVRFLVSQLKWGEGFVPKAVMIAGTLISAHFSWFYFEKWAVSKGHQKFTY